jgi:hypothetical protein
MHAVMKLAMATGHAMQIFNDLPKPLEILF